VLKVTKVRDTNILEIAVTLPDPRQAQSLAQYLADETVTLNRNANRENDRDLIARAEEQFADAQKRLEGEQTTWREFNVHNPVEALRVEIETQTTLLQRLQRDLVEARVGLGDLTGHADESSVARARAHAQNLEKQEAELRRQMDASSTLLSRRETRAEELQQSLRAAGTSYDAAAGRLRESRAATGLRGERLRVMDPGVIPERPTSPSVGLNVLLAFAVALASCITYLALTFHPAK
jgi:capsule polysaccharide export protein KpsE/RkpR